MSRVPDLPESDMTGEQARLYDEIKGPRGIVAGPFALWIRVPEIADAANRFGNALRIDGKLDRGLFEMMTLIIARHWNAQYEWFAHEKAALANGIGSAIVEALRNAQPPPFERDDQRVIYDLTSELQTARTLSRATYDRGIAAFGLDLMIEIVSVAGFYTTAAMMINAFQSPVPGDARPLPELPPI